MRVAKAAAAAAVGSGRQKGPELGEGREGPPQKKAKGARRPEEGASLAPKHPPPRASKRA